MKAKTEIRVSYLILVLPALLLYLFVMAFPTVFSISLSLTNYSGGSLFVKEKVKDKNNNTVLMSFKNKDGAPQVKEKEKTVLNFKFIGFKSYINIFKDSYFYLSLKNNLWIVLMSVFGQIPLGFFLAYILSRGLIKRVDFFQTVIYLPNVISAVIIGILFNKFFLSSNSIWLEIQHLFNPAAEFNPGQNPMLPVLIVMLWMYTGIYVIIFLANLQKIDVSVIEASKIDGASEMQTLRFIILPALSGVIVTTAILAISGSLKSFDLIYVMTQGGPAHKTSVLSLYMYEKAFRGAPNYPIANAISTVMVIISFILIIITRSVEKYFGAKE